MAPVSHIHMYTEAFTRADTDLLFPIRLEVIQHDTQPEAVAVSDKNPIRWHTTDFLGIQNLASNVSFTAAREHWILCILTLNHPRRH